MVEAVVSPDDWAALTILGEAAHEPAMGQLAIGEVIRTRMKTRFFSDGSVAGTVLRPMQFSCWNSGNGNRPLFCQVLRSDLFFIAAAAAWASSASSLLTPTANSYYNPDLVIPVWAAKAVIIAKIGRHVFVRV